MRIIGLFFGLLFSLNVAVAGDQNAKLYAPGIDDESTYWPETLMLLHEGSGSSHQVWFGEVLDETFGYEIDGSVFRFILPAMPERLVFCGNEMFIIEANEAMTYEVPFTKTKDGKTIFDVEGDLFEFSDATAENIDRIKNLPRCRVETKK